MKRYLSLLLVIILSLSVITGCTKNLYSAKETETDVNVADNQTAGQTKTTSASNQTSVSVQSSATDNTQGEATNNSQSAKPEKAVIDYNQIKPNEAGQIMVVMFHNFVETYPKGNNEYTTTFSEFERLLDELYAKKYRLVNISDMINNNISVPAGCIPMVFTFDDGTAGQFNLIEQNGKLVANPRSAVGIMEAFAEKHPDFGLKGTFYVNLGVKSTFKGSGTINDRLDYLISRGYEIGNHTKTHVSLPSVKTVQNMLEEVGGNQVLMNEIVPDYAFNSFSLPFGNASKNLQEYVVQGNYQGQAYKHTSVVLVGANPAPSPVSTKFNPLALPRVRSTGEKKVECDLAWWLDTLSKGTSQYISDGDTETVTVPQSKKQNVDMAKLNGKQLVTY